MKWEPAVNEHVGLRAGRDCWQEVRRPVSDSSTSPETEKTDVPVFDGELAQDRETGEPQS